jgi:hypothetical protein
MWTPPQWRIAFPAVAVVLVGCLAVLISAHSVGWSSIAGAAGGLIAGLILSIGWTLRALLAPLFSLQAFTALLALAAVWLAEPQGLLVAVAVAAGTAFAWIAGYHFLYTERRSPSVARQVESVGQGGRGRVLIAFHPGRSDFQTRLQRALAERMAACGWRVDLVTAHPSSPNNAEAYDLVVFGTPAYNFRPATPLLRYLKRLRALDGKRVVLLVTGGGITDSALRFLRRRVEAKGARIIRSLEIWTTRANAERYDAEDPLEIVRLAGVSLATHALE